MNAIKWLAAAAGCAALPFATSADVFNPYGICAHVTRGENTVRTAELMRPAGLGWARSDFDWRTIERKQGEWDFSRFDKVIDDLEARGVRLLPILGYSVPWANPAHEHLDAWGEYVRRCAERYGKRLPVLEVWNEENIEQFWKNPNPTNYLAVLRRAYEEVKRVDPSLKVGFGGTAGVPFNFIEEVYRLGGAKFFDIMMIHPYSHPRRPEGAMDAQIERLRDMMARYGDADKPMWITEIGWPTHTANIPDVDVLRAGLKAVDPDKAIWRALYVPAQSMADGDAHLVSLQTVASDFMKAEACDARHVADRLARGDVDVVVYPFTEEYAADSVPAVHEFVKKGGVLVDFGGMPLWTPTRMNAEGDMDVARGVAAWRDRQRFRISETAWWMDKRYPNEMPVRPVGPAAGANPPKKGFSGTRFFTDRLLKPGDRMIPLLSAPTNGVDAVAACVYRFDSDMKGCVIVSGIMKGSHGTSDEARQAKMVARALGISFAERVEAFLLYNLRCGEYDPFDPESFFGVVRANFVPKPGYGAYMAFVDRRPVGSVQKDVVWRSADRQTYFPQWKRPDGRDAGMVWTTGAARTLRLVFSSQNVSFMDVNGNVIHPKRNGAGYDVRVGDAPVYFCGGELKVDSFRELVVPPAADGNAAAYLEKVRDMGSAARAFDPGATVTATGTDAFAKAFIALGEAEEIDVWRMDGAPTPERVRALRALFDGAGGKAVRLVDANGKPLDAPAPRPAANARPLSGALPSPLYVAGSGRICILDPDGKVVWERRGCGNVHRVQRVGDYLYYSNGNVYRCRLPSTKAELVYRPDTRTGGGALGFDVAPDGSVVVAVNATDEVMELDRFTFRPVVRFKVNAKDAKGNAPGRHFHLRMVRKTAAGTYLVACMGAQAVREYDRAGRLVWEQDVSAPAFDVLRRADGSTVVSHVTGITEFAPDRKAAWSIAAADLPELKAANFCGIQELPNGNLVVGTWANGVADASRATAFEVTREKKAVWSWASPDDCNMMGAAR